MHIRCGEAERRRCGLKLGLVLEDARVSQDRGSEGRSRILVLRQMLSGLWQSLERGEETSRQREAWEGT